MEYFLVKGKITEHHYMQDKPRVFEDIRLVKAESAADAENKRKNNREDYTSELAIRWQDVIPLKPSMVHGLAC